MGTASTHRPTIIDVAREAGVSKSLVSLAVRGDPGVSSQTREHILRVAASVGYRSNAWARSLVKGRSQLIGVLLTDLQNAYHTDIVNGVEDAAADAGFDVVLGHGRRDRRVLVARLGQLLELGVDGVVVISAHLEADRLAEVSGRVPLVVVGRPRSVPDGAGWVSNDDELGARLAIEHLARLGHSRIAHLSGSSRPAALVRRDSYAQAMDELGLGSAAVFDATEVERLVAVVADGAADAPTAVFAGNDRHAAALLTAALDAGLRVPDDLAIVGYDNTELAAVVRPGLTSVDQPRRAMGRAAMAQLTGMLAGEAAARHEVMQPSLVVRASTVG